MRHTKYGEMIDTGLPHKDGGTEGMIGLSKAVNLTEMISIPVSLDLSPIAQTGPGGMGVLGLQLSGEVLGQREDPEYLTTTWVIPWMDAGKLAALLIEAAVRAGKTDEQAQQDFAIGLHDAMGSDD